MMDHCPTCSAAVPEDSVWLVNRRFYCSETCAMKAYSGSGVGTDWR